MVKELPSDEPDHDHVHGEHVHGAHCAHGQKPITVAKVGRNESCPCNSGKKFKKCCGASK